MWYSDQCVYMRGTFFQFTDCISFLYYDCIWHTEQSEGVFLKSVCAVRARNGGKAWGRVTDHYGLYKECSGQTCKGHDLLSQVVYLFSAFPTVLFIYVILFFSICDTVNILSDRPRF